MAGSCLSTLFLALFWSFPSLQLASFPPPLDTHPLSQITNILDYLWKLLISQRAGPTHVQEALLLEGGYQPAVCESHSGFSGQAFWRAPLKQIWADSRPLRLGIVKHPADYLQLP